MNPLTAVAGLSEAGAGHAGPHRAEPLVSVLVPSYNHERFVGRSLDSILSDGYPNLEVIIVDDGSSDSTYEVARRWVIEHQARLTGGARLIRQENRGVVKTLNRLVAEARGDFITVLASDDCLCPGSIAARVEYLLRHPRYLAVFGDATGIDEDDAVVYESVITGMHHGNRRALRCDATRARELILQWCVPGPVYLARRDVLWKIGLYDERYCFEDRNYYLRLIKEDALGFLDRTVALYRVSRVPTGQRFSRLSEDYDLIHADLRSQFRGADRLALAVHMALRQNRVTGPAGPSGVRRRLVAKANREMIRLNRRLAAVIMAVRRGGDWE